MFSISAWSQKGMALIPVLTGLNRTQAESALTSAGFIPNYSGTLDTSTSSYHGLVATQSVISGSLADYESTINFTIFNYVSSGGGTPTPTPTCQAHVEVSDPGWGACSGSPGYQSKYVTTTVTDSSCNTTTTVPYFNQPCLVSPCIGGTYASGGTGCSDWSYGSCTFNSQAGQYLQTLTRTCRDQYCNLTTEYQYVSCTPSGGGGTYY